MMFNKDNTNFNGDCLCKTCKWGAPVYLGPDIHKATDMYICVSDAKTYKNVGVCKYYDEFKKESI